MKHVSPTEKQIDYADLIAYTLELDFPTCSADFTKQAYQKFISKHENTFKEIRASDPAFEDEMSWWDPHAESGY